MPQIESAATTPETIRPSPMWTASISVVVIIALVIGVAATVTSIKSTRFIGEGELLFEDAARAAARIADSEGPEVLAGLRRVRNDLDVEAVSLVDPEGVFIASTSETLVGMELAPMLERARSNGRFSAVAVPTTRPVLVDGVTEWETGQALYQAMHPVAEGAVVLHYDISELLHRRAVATRLPPHVVPMAVVSGVLMLVAAGLFVARSRVTRTRREMVIEAEFLRRQSEDLTQHNVELEMARAETETALALAEEKNRIRSEFVLMINHELRTPLTGVVTGARLLEASGRLSEEDTQIVADMIHDGDRLEAMIGQVLAVARVENRGLKVVPVEMGLGDLAERLARAHRGVRFNHPERLIGQNVTVRTDATTLAQLVASLTDNAYTHGAEQVSLTMGESLPDMPHLVVGDTPKRALHVIVTDDGPGIDPGFLPRAFDKFQKSSKSSGTGLGLHFCRMMAESIGASISVRTSNNGTWMAISIPADLTPEVLTAEVTR